MEYISEIHRLLKLGDNQPMRVNGAPEGLAVGSLEQKHSASVMALPVEQVHERIYIPEISETPQAKQKTFKLKSLLIYPAVFLAAFLFFYIVLNFPSIMAQVQGSFTKPQDAQVLGDQQNAYYQWVGGYYFSISDKKSLEPNNDLDEDGLSNMDEFIIRTNPTIADSDSDGFSDGIEIINNMNPWGSGKMTTVQRKLLEKVNMIIINNRISYNAASNTKSNPDHTNVTTANYDLNKPGRLSIPRLKLQAPLIWSKDPSQFETDLTKGVIHYPGTSLPGEVGTIYVSGHSSDYLWKKDPFSSVFAQINFLQPGDDIFIDVYGLDGKAYIYRYQVFASKIYKPDDQTQFIDNSLKKLNLSTCWPIGTQQDRYVVSAVETPL